MTSQNYKSKYYLSKPNRKILLKKILPITWIGSIIWTLGQVFFGYLYLT